MRLQEVNTIQFKKAYQLLKNKSDWKLSIQIYHHDFSSESFFSAESDVERIVLDYVDEHRLIITILTNETSYSFSEKNWSVNVDLDESYIAFRSKNDGKTHCIIEFC